ncbi:SDR family oxidoreductase [Nocardiopsis eucommiae]|uniref:SDR family oxidoreductase n=1 Tax=Nocardiopsis eucommiae TaxID=2831970 RepID=UPI003D72E3E0
MTLLIVGATGHLGSQLLTQATRTGRTVTATHHRRTPTHHPHIHWTPLDLRSPHQVHTLITTLRPTAIINAASRPHDWPTTAQGPGHLARAAATTGAHLVHVSSDAVFSGHAPSYDETAHPDPLTPYGAAKAAAETVVTALHPTTAIARTSLILGDDSPHEHRVRDLANGTTTGALFTDDLRCPVHVHDLAAALLELTDPAHTGIHHLAGPHALSRHELGVLIARHRGLPTTLPRTRRAEVGPPGPLEIRLDSTRTQRRLTTTLRGARDFLT